MTHFVEGSIITRELRDMVNEQVAETRFEQELSSYEDNLFDRLYKDHPLNRRSTQ